MNPLVSLARLPKHPDMKFAPALVALGVCLSTLQAGLPEQVEEARAASDTHAEIELLRRWLDANPDDQGALQRLTSLWLTASDFDMAEKTVGVVTDPGFGARTRAEILLRRDDNLKDALAVLRERSNAAPKDRDSRILLADYLRKGSLFTEQIVVLDSLLAGEPDANLLLDRAGAKLVAGQPEKALADFRRAASIAPEDERLARERAGYERVERALNEISDGSESAASPALFRAYWFLYAGLPSAAVEESRAGREAWPDSALGKILEARALASIGMIDATKARDEFRVELSTGLESPGAFSDLLAIEANLESNRADATARSARAGWLIKERQYLLASGDVEELLQASPKSASSLQLAVSLNRRLGNLSSAMAFANLLEKSKASQSTRSGALREVAELALEQSNVPLAMELATRSLNAQPSRAGWTLKAACHERLGQQAEAAEAKSKAEKEKR